MAGVFAPSAAYVTSFVFGFIALVFRFFGLCVPCLRLSKLPILFRRPLQAPVRGRMVGIRDDLVQVCVVGFGQAHLLACAAFARKAGKLYLQVGHGAPQGVHGGHVRFMGPGVGLDGLSQ